MPRLFSRACIFSLCRIMLLSVIVLAAGAEMYPVRAALKNPFLAKSVKDEINVRSDASIQSEQIAIVRRNEQVTVVDEKYDWYKIVLPPRIDGYVYASYVQASGPQQGIVTASSVNIRLKPDLQGLIIGTVKKRERLSVKGKECDWAVEQAYPYAKGWIHKSLVQPLTAPETAAVSMEPPAQQDIPMAVSAFVPERSTLRLFQKVFEMDGVIKKNEQKSFCDAPYLLKTSQGNVFLQAPDSLDAYLSKRVRVAGTYSLGPRCIFLDAASLKITR